VPTHRSANPFCHGARRDSELRQTEVLDAAVERGAEDLVAVADQSCEPNVGADRLDDLLRRPFGPRVLGDVHVDLAAAFEREHEETKNTYNTPNVTVGTVKKSIAIVPTAWVRMNVPHVWDGGRSGHAACTSPPRPCPRRGRASRVRRDPATAPQWVLTGHSHDERHDLRREWGSPDAPRLPGPEARETARGATRSRSPA
jgi:hypothetical protein